MPLPSSVTDRAILCWRLRGLARLVCPKLRIRYEIVAFKATRTAMPAAFLFLISCHHDDAAVAAPLKNASRSALIWSAFVVGMPCGKPL